MKRGRSGIELKSDDQIRTMRRAGLIVAETLRALRAAAAPGVSTAELDGLAAEIIAAAGATSSFLDYGGGYGAPPYPARTCISINNEVVHGVPSDRKLVEGDLVSIDFGAAVSGWHADAAITFGVGSLEPRAEELSEVTRTALWEGIAAARIGGRVQDISAAISASIRSHGPGYGIVAGYTGHGIGSAMHQLPDVPNQGRAGQGALLTKGTCLALEPMVCLGSPATAVLPDDWTVVTRDGSLAAHWEHTIALTPGGIWVLTEPDGGAVELAARGAKFAPLAD